MELSGLLEKINDKSLCAFKCHYSSHDAKEIIALHTTNGHVFNLLLRAFV